MRDQLDSSRPDGPLIRTDDAIYCDTTGQTIEEEPILSLLARRREEADVVVAEGAGGLLVPLSDDLLYADLVARSGYRVIIVSPNVLGTINVTLLTVEAARRRDIDVAGVILNRTPPTALGNAEAIARHGQVPVLGEFPDAEGADDHQLAELARATIDIDMLLG